MKISVAYNTQLKQRAECASDDFGLADGATVADLIAAIADRRPATKALLLRDDGSCSKVVLAFVDGEQAARDGSAPLRDGAIVTFLMPIAGG